MFNIVHEKHESHERKSRIGVIHRLHGYMNFAPPSKFQLGKLVKLANTFVLFAFFVDEMIFLAA